MGALGSICWCAMLVLLARHKVQPDKLEGYMKWAEAVDKAVEDTEPGMVAHTLDRDPEDTCSFVWTEVYANDAALIAHLENKPVLEALGAMPGFLEGGLEIEAYGEVGDEAKALVTSMELPVKYFEPSGVGYNRD